MGRNVANQIDHLVQALASREIETSLAARKALVAWGEDAVDALIAACNHEDVRIVANAIVALGLITSPRSLPMLIENLDHPHTLVRMQAARALSYYQSAAAVTALMEHLPTATGIDQQKILQALLTIGTSDIIPPLLQLLHTTGLATTRYMAIRVLAKIGDASLISHIERYQDDENHHVRDDAQAAINILRKKDNVPEERYNQS